MKQGDKYRCALGRGILEVKEVIDHEHFILINKHNEYVHHIRDINKTIFKYNEKQHNKDTYHQIFIYDEKKQEALLPRLYESVDKKLINNEVRALKSLNIALNIEAIKITEQTDKLPGKYEKGIRTTDDMFGLLSDKESRSLKLNELDKIRNIEENPYLSSIEVVSKQNKNEVFYIGKTDHDYNNTRVYSWQSQIGRMHYLKDQKEFTINKVNYLVNKRHDYDISHCILNSYFLTNYSVDHNEDSNAIYDSFLLEVIKKQRNNEHIKDIISTIQEIQYKIISVEFDSDILVQGCAGSGKTMIMLHRLSYLFYNKFIRPSDVLILTPNSNLSGFIQPIMKELEIDDVNVDTLFDFINKAYQSYSGEELLFTYSSNYDIDLQKTLLQKFDGYIVSEISKYVDKIIDDELLRFLSQFSEIPDTSMTSIKRKQVVYKEQCESVLRKEIVIYNEALKKLNDKKIEFESIVSLKSDKIKNIKKEIDQLSILIESKSNHDNNVSNSSNRGILNRVMSFIGFNQDVTLDTDQRSKENISNKNKLQEEISKLNKEIQEFTSKGNRVAALLTKMKSRSLDANEQFTIIHEISKETGRLSNSKEFIFNLNTIDYLKNKLVKLKREFNPNSAISYYLDKMGVSDLEEVIKNKLKLLFWIKYDGPRLNYKMIVIDETQDYSMVDLELIRLLNKGDVVFNYYGDKHQNVYSHRFDWSQLNLNSRVKTFNLIANYRNSYEITSYYKDKLKKSDEPIGVRENKVKEFIRLQDALNEYFNTVENKIIIVKDSHAVHKLLSTIENENSNSDLKKEVLTVREVKGMEFKSALVLTNEMEINELYIAYTRARTNLMVFNHHF